MSGIDFSKFNFSVYLPHTYQDANGKRQVFKPGQGEFYSTADGFPNVFAARTRDGAWLLGAITGKRGNPSERVPLWDAYAIDWRQVDTFEAADWFNVKGLKQPASLGADIEKRRRIADLARQSERSKPIENNPPIRCTQADILRADGLNARWANYLRELEQKDDIVIVERAEGRKQRHLIQFRDPARRALVERSIQDYRRDGTKPARKDGRKRIGS